MPEAKRALNETITVNTLTSKTECVNHSAQSSEAQESSDELIAQPINDVPFASVRFKARPVFHHAEHSEKERRNMSARELHFAVVALIVAWERNFMRARRSVLRETPLARWAHRQRKQKHEGRVT
jgi:hypothetical protein